MRPPKCFSCSMRFRNVYFISVGSRISLVNFYAFQCKSKPKLNYENKDDKKFEVVLRSFFADFKIHFFDFDSQICFF